MGSGANRGNPCAPGPGKKVARTSTAIPDVDAAPGAFLQEPTSSTPDIFDGR